MFALYMHTGRADIRYDFQRNRAVYLIKQGNKVVDAAGRSLDDRTPKWYRYGSSKKPFICGNHTDAVLVEDCASASAISNIVTGVALLGTNLLQQHLESLSKYSRLHLTKTRLTKLLTWYAYLGVTSLQN